MMSDKASICCILVSHQELPHNPYRQAGLTLENVEHCGGEPEQADTGISCHW